MEPPNLVSCRSKRKYYDNCADAIKGTIDAVVDLLNWRITANTLYLPTANEERAPQQKHRPANLEPIRKP
jgi:hypothetical protein